MKNNYKISSDTRQEKGRGRLHQGGFTLIDLSIALLVIGIIMAPIIYLYNTQKQLEIIADQRKNFNLIQNALFSFVEQNGRYPLPASLLESYSGTASYGAEFPVGTLPQNCPSIATDGLCVADTTPPNPATRILIGAVPVSTLKIPPEIALDNWGNKLIYAVTLRQTDPASYARTDNGAIRLFAINANNGNPVELVEVIHPTTGTRFEYTNVDVFMATLGPSAKGAYTADGVLVEACAAPGLPEYEDMNCSFTNSFMIDENKRRENFLGTYRVCPNQEYCNGTRNLIEGPTFYDDFTHEIDFKPINLSYDFNQNNKSYVVSEATRIAIGHSSPGGALDVMGDVLIQPKPDPANPANTISPGRLITAEICDGSGSSCLEPDLLAGNRNEMNCFETAGAGTGLQPVKSVGDNRVVCGTPATATSFPNQPSNYDGVINFPTSVLQNGVCGTGRYLQGLSNGVPICASP